MVLNDRGGIKNVKIDIFLHIHYDIYLMKTVLFEYRKQVFLRFMKETK